jgi:hypothetical protein
MTAEPCTVKSKVGGHVLVYDPALAGSRSGRGPSPFPIHMPMRVPDPLSQQPGKQPAKKTQAQPKGTTAPAGTYACPPLPRNHPEQILKTDRIQCGGGRNHPERRRPIHTCPDKHMRPSLDTAAPVLSPTTPLSNLVQSLQKLARHITAGAATVTVSKNNNQLPTQQAASGFAQPLLPKRREPLGY